MNNRKMGIFKGERVIFSQPRANYGTERFKKFKQLFEYHIYSYLETSGGHGSNLYLNVVHFFNTCVN